MRTQSLGTLKVGRQSDNLPALAEAEEEDEEKGCCKGECNWKHWWPRLLVIGILLILITIAIIYRSQVS